MATCRTRRFRVVLALTVLPAAAAWAQVPAGPEFLVNTYTPGNQWNFPFGPGASSVAPNGDFVIVWSSANGQDGSNAGVFAQRFSAAGTRLGGEFRVNTYTTGRQAAATPAFDGRGGFVVVWDSDAQDGSGYGVFGQRYDANGAPLGSEFLVNTTTADRQGEPTVGADAAGNFVVAWTSFSQGVVGQRFDAAGNRRGAEFRVSAYATTSEGDPSLDVDAAGNFVVVWRIDPGMPFGRRFDALGNPVGSNFAVSASGGALPVVALAEYGFVVAWDRDDIYARRFDPVGNPLGPEIQVGSTAPGYVYNLDVDADSVGNFVVVWSHPLGLQPGFARRHDSGGAPRGPAFQVNPGIWTSLVSDAVGNLVVSWTGSDPSPFGVRAQRFGGLQPVALSVDGSPTSSSNGNGVLEAGESVTVAPSWRNVNGAAQTFAGAGSAFAGPGAPGDPIYLIKNSTAAYGSVPDGATASCAASGDCYLVATSVPSARPVRHWDASLREDILPVAHGQSKRWTIHVGDSFTDVLRSSPFYRYIETLLHHQVTTGCGPTQYCPASVTSRAQMAVFVLVAKEGAGYVPPACGATPMFADVPASSPFCRWIEELARRGVVGGCGGGNYCPAAPVSREQMSAFVLRTLDPTLNPPGCVPPNIYNDVPETSPFCRWIEELTSRGVVGGCGGGSYCPAAPVNRQQMGVFLSVTFGLVLYGP